MKNRFGFIPIVLPVLVMVLIIGLINWGGATEVQATEIPNTHPRLNDSDGLIINKHGGVDGSGSAERLPDTSWTPTPFSPGESAYKVTATYDVEFISVAAGVSSPNSALVKVTKPGEKTIVLAADATTTIPVGQVTLIDVEVSNAANNFSQKTIYRVELTREFPQFATLGLFVNTSERPNNARDLEEAHADNKPKVANAVVLNEVDLPLPGTDPALRDREVDVRVKYHIDEIGMRLTLPGGLDGAETNTTSDDLVNVRFNNIPSSRVSVTANENTYDVKKHPLSVGKNQVDILVSAKANSGHYTSYRIIVERAKPLLESVRVGTTPVPGMGLDTTVGEFSVAYNVTSTSVSGSGGLDTEVKYARKSGEGRDDVNTDALGFYDVMTLAEGENTLYIDAYDKEDSRAGKTRYTLNVERRSTPLGALTVRTDSTNSAFDGELVDLFWDEDHTSTSTRKGYQAGGEGQDNDEREANNKLNVATTTFWASVPYDVEKVDVSASVAAFPTPVNGVYKRTISLRGHTTSTATTTGASFNPLSDTFDLRYGNNPIKVTAEIPGNSTVFTLNVMREKPVTRPSEVSLIELPDGDVNDAEVVELMPEYHQASTTDTTYNATVRSNVTSVGIAADHGSPLSEIYVRDTQIEKGTLINYADYKVVLLDGAETVIPVTVTIGAFTGEIRIVVKRNPSGTLNFIGTMHPMASVQDPIRQTDEVPLANPIILPASTSDDGEVEYHIRVRDEDNKLIELSEIGLEFDADAREITGTPDLAEGEGYESRFLVEYWGRDPVGNVTDTLKFVFIITHDPTDPIPALGTGPAAPANNTLKSLAVEDNKVAGFDPESAGPYSADVKQTVKTATIEAVPTHADAMVYLEGVLFDENNEAETETFGQPLDITVTYPGLPAMTYTLTINREDVKPGDLRFPIDVGNKTYVMDEKIEDLVLPEALGGAGSYTYSLLSKTPNEADDPSPADLTFNPTTRTLSGTPELFDAYHTTYKMHYTVTDGDGVTYTDTFMMVVCDPDNPLSGDCRSSSSDVSLSSLALSGVTLMPEFDSATMAYTAEVPYETTMVTVSSMTDDVDDITVSVSSDMDDDIADGQVDLVAGANVITVEAKKEYGSYHTTTYMVTVTRDEKSNDATLSALSLSAGTLTPAFDSDTTAYTASVGYNTASVTVTAMASDANATVSGAGSQTLSVGENPISVTVLAEDGVTSMIYTITVTRELPTITATIMAFRDGSTARVTWTPSAGATLQAAAMVAVKPGVTTPTSVDDVEIDTLTYLNASGGNATTDWQIPGSTSMLNISGLDTGKRYLFAVVGWDGSAWSAWQTVVE